MLIGSTGNDTGNDTGASPIVFIFGTVALLAALGDLRMLLRRSFPWTQRIARHLWRMCFALWIAAASFFLGQADEFPEALRNSGLLPVPVLLVLFLMFYWLVRVLFTQWYRRVYQQVPADVSALLRKAPDAGRSAAK